MTRAGRLLLFLIACALTLEARDSDLSFVRCWPRNQQSNPVSHSLTSEILTSPSHWRAYATVTASHLSNGSCHDTTRLYVARPGEDFVPVFKRSAMGTKDGNGIRILGWSPDGKKLLAEATDWAYGSDAPPGRTVLVYSGRNGMRALDIGKSLGEHFGGACLFDYSVQRWHTESTILLRVRPFHEVFDERKSCVKRPTTFIYQIASRALQSF